MKPTFFSQARLRLDRSTTDVQRQRKVSELLMKVGLTACSGSMIGAAGQDKVLSGGEKKRLAFATEVQMKLMTVSRHFNSAVSTNFCKEYFIIETP